MIPLTADVVGSAPVIVRGTLIAITPGMYGSATLTVSVDETLRGTELEVWLVHWSAESVIGPPASLDAFEERYGGLDIVVGLAPDVLELPLDSLPERPVDGMGRLLQHMCGAPFLGGFVALAPMLRAEGLIE